MMGHVPLGASPFHMSVTTFKVQTPRTFLHGSGQDYVPINRLKGSKGEGCALSTVGQNLRDQARAKADKWWCNAIAAYNCERKNLSRTTTHMCQNLKWEESHRSWVGSRRESFERLDPK